MLNAVPSRFKLPADQVDALIGAGGDALRGNPVFQEFLASVGVRAPGGMMPPPRFRRFTPPRVADVPAAADGLAAAMVSR